MRLKHLPDLHTLGEVCKIQTVEKTDSNPSLWKDGEQEFILEQTRAKIKLAAPTIPLEAH